MVNQQQTNNSAQLENLTEALAAARNMQQDWLNYGLNFVHIYVEDVFSWNAGRRNPGEPNSSTQQKFSP